MGLKSAFIFFIAVASLQATANDNGSHRISLYRDVSDHAPATIFSGRPRRVDIVDVNWRGGNGRNVNAEVLGDGEVIWSGIIPAYDPTFRVTPRRNFSHMELRVSGGSAYVNWVQIYGGSGGQTSRCGRGTCDLNFIGNLDNAGELASQLIGIITGLQTRDDFNTNKTHWMPLKVAGARVYSIASASGNYRQIDVYNAVVGLEMEFRKQDAFLRHQMEITDDFQPILGLQTIRERYKALFGSTQYPVAN